MATSSEVFRAPASAQAWDAVQRRAAASFAQIVHSCSACPARPATIFSTLEQARLRELDRFRKSIRHPAGAVVFFEGDHPSAVYGVCSGAVKLSSCSSEGRTVILRIATAGDVLGVCALLSGNPHEVTAETLEPTRVCRIPKDAFLDFLHRNSDLGLKLAERLSRELVEASQQVRATVLKPSSDRLMELLKSLCEAHGERTPEGIRLSIKLCQDELAALAGVSRRSLNRGLARLRELGILESRRGAIVVRDSAALRGIMH